MSAKHSVRIFDILQMLKLSVKCECCCREEQSCLSRLQSHKRTFPLQASYWPTPEPVPAVQSAAFVTPAFLQPTGDGTSWSLVGGHRTAPTFLCVFVCLLSCDEQTHHHHSNISGYLSNCELTVGGAVIHRISASLCLACSARVR